MSEELVFRIVVRSRAVREKIITEMNYRLQKRPINGGMLKDNLPSVLLKREEPAAHGAATEELQP